MVGVLLQDLHAGNAATVSFSIRTGLDFKSSPVLIVGFEILHQVLYAYTTV
jgi:hypothetical protein